MRPPRFLPGLIVGGLLGIGAAGALQVSSHGSGGTVPAATANDTPDAPKSILAPDTPERTTPPPAKPVVRKPVVRKPRKVVKRHVVRHNRRVHRKHHRRTHRVRAAAPVRKYVPPPTPPRVYVAPKPVYVAPKRVYVAPRRTPPPPPPAPRPRPRPSPPPQTFDDSG